MPWRNFEAALLPSLFINGILDLPYLLFVHDLGVADFDFAIICNSHLTWVLDDVVDWIDVLALQVIKQLIVLMA